MELEDTRLGELAARYRLTAAQRRALRGLLEVIAREAAAPTAVRDPARAVDVHVADSLVALEVEAVRGAVSVADLGAGAGFPGLPLAIALPGSEVALLESQARHCLFLEDTVAELAIDNAQVMCTRAEAWQEGLGSRDVVLARALAPQPVVLEYAAPLLRAGGALVDWRGRRDGQEEARSAAAARVLGLERAEIRQVAPFDAARNRHLHLYLKVGPTPKRFPRRAGIARRRPLG